MLVPIIVVFERSFQQINAVIIKNALSFPTLELDLSLQHF